MKTATVKLKSNYTPMCISMPRDLAKKARVRASTLRRNLSNYIQVLIENDVRGEVVADAESKR